MLLTAHRATTAAALCYCCQTSHGLELMTALGRGKPGNKSRAGAERQLCARQEGSSEASGRGQRKGMCAEWSMPWHTDQRRDFKGVGRENTSKAFILLCTGWVASCSSRMQIRAALIALCRDPSISHPTWLGSSGRWGHHAGFVLQRRDVLLCWGVLFPSGYPGKQAGNCKMGAELALGSRQRLGPTDQ